MIENRDGISLGFVQLWDSSPRYAAATPSVFRSVTVLPASDAPAASSRHKRAGQSRVRCEGTASTWTRTGDEGGTCTFHFCPHCGATVYYIADDLPDVIAIPIGAFADPQFPTPTFSVYEVRKASVGSLAR